MSRIIAVANVKGGVGKTTTTSNLGAALAVLGRRVLAVDMDPQASLSFSLGLPQNKMTRSICDVLDDGGRPIASVSQTTQERIDLVPSCSRLSKIAKRLEGTNGGITFLRAALETLRDNYDYILIDCPAQAGILTESALAAADHVIIPVLPDILSVQALNFVLDIIGDVCEKANPSLRVAGILLTMYDSRTRHAREIMDLVHKTYGADLPFFNAVVHDSVRVKEAVKAGKSIIAYLPNSQPALAYRALAEEIETGIRQTEENELYFVLARGEDALQHQDFKLAFAAFCRATDIDPKLTRAWIGRAESAPAWDEAARCMMRAVRLDPQQQYTRANLERRLDEKTKNAVNSDIPEMIMLAHFSEEMEFPSYANSLYACLNELDARNEEAWLGRARTTAQSKDAVAYVQRCLELNPKNLLAQAALAQATARVKADAQKMVDEGAALLRSGKRDEAHTKFVQATELDPQNDRAWVGCAQTARDWPSTYDFARRAVQINPQNAEARELYAYAWGPRDVLPESRMANRVYLIRYLIPILLALIVLAFILYRVYIG